MFMHRFRAIVIAGLAMVGGVGSSHADSYGQYPSGAYGQESYFNENSNRYFHPARNVTCDRSLDVCYDRYGLSYYATKRYVGEREANRAKKKYGDKVFLFSPKRGVICDRRTQTCTKARWANSGYGNGGSSHGNWEKGNFGAMGSGNRPAREQEQYWPYNNDR
jgi:hypothetical protein